MKSYIDFLPFNTLREKIKKKKNDNIIRMEIF